MARPLRISYPHAYYHVTCRGNDRRAIFRDDRDRTLFLEKLRVSIEIYDVKLHAYVLMGNHFHFIAETPKANLSEFMLGIREGTIAGIEGLAICIKGATRLCWWRKTVTCWNSAAMFI